MKKQIASYENELYQVKHSQEVRPKKKKNVKKEIKIQRTITRYIDNDIDVNVFLDTVSACLKVNIDVSDSDSE